ncbi:MAG: hypothetical protein ABIQ12_09860, partial [Opitutaceae bacterium]
VNQARSEAIKGKKKAEDTPAAALFNLDDDLGEKTDLASRQPDRVRELQAALSAWRTDVSSSPPRP